jgi:hypothetical protein
MGVEHGKDDGTNKDDNETAKRKIFDQAKGFGALFGTKRFHRIAGAAVKSR